MHDIGMMHSTQTLWWRKTRLIIQDQSARVVRAASTIAAEQSYTCPHSPDDARKRGMLDRFGQQDSHNLTTLSGCHSPLSVMFACISTLSAASGEGSVG
jgi:hypothetical protein